MKKNRESCGRFAVGFFIVLFIIIVVGITSSPKQEITIGEVCEKLCKSEPEGIWDCVPLGPGW
jgi:hypothetical protein